MAQKKGLSIYLNDTASAEIRRLHNIKRRTAISAEFGGWQSHEIVPSSLEWRLVHVTCEGPWEFDNDEKGYQRLWRCFPPLRRCSVGFKYHQWTSLTSGRKKIFFVFRKLKLSMLFETLIFTYLLITCILYIDGDDIAGLSEVEGKPMLVSICKSNITWLAMLGGIYLLGE